MQEMTTETVKYRIDFLKYRYIWLAISIGYLLVGLGAYFVKGGFKYSIDFTGGAEIRLSFEKQLDTGSLRSVMSAKGFKDAIIQSVGNTNRDFLIRVGSMSNQTESQIKTALSEGLADNKVTISGIQWVGSEVGKDTTKNAIIAVLLSMLVLLFYIAIRFEFRFGVGAVAELIHDVLALLVFILLFDIPISLHVLASVLSVLGYSLHDSIVIFSRIRENFKKIHGVPEYDIVNLSTNQTLKRTILTSFATLLSVAAMLVLGGESLHGLSLILFVGIIVGTYSSLYIANPVMLLFKGKKHSS